MDIDIDPFADAGFSLGNILAAAVVSSGGALVITEAALKNELAYENKVLQLDWFVEKAELVITLGDRNGNQG